MLTEPKLEERAKRHYAAIAVQVPMQEIAVTVPPLLPEVFAWLETHGVAPAGPPFFRYVVVDMGGLLEIEAGVPVASPVAGDARVRAGSFPAGRYATAVHTGPYEQLEGATRALLRWGEENGIAWQVEPAGSGERWGARAEFYLTDPLREPDPEHWETELAFLVRP
jgi:effector-binding domain-containing protein